jgi:adenylate kinase
VAQIRIGGVYGVGKTTIINAALEDLKSEQRIIVPRIKGSLIMARLLGVQPDQLPEVPEEERQRVREAMYKEIAEIPHGVRDAHFAVLTANGGYEFPRSPVDGRCVGALALVTADAAAIAQRRAGLGRPYRATDHAAIKTHLEVEQAAAEVLAQELAVPLYTIDNSGDTIQPAVSAMQQAILAHCR